MNPSTDERQEIIAASADIFRRRFYSPTLDGLNLNAILSERMSDLLITDSFATDLEDVFARSGARPIEIFREPDRKVSLSRFLKATLFETPEREYVFRDVLIGGRARRAGVETGDRLTTVNGVAPPSEDTRVNAHDVIEIGVEKKSGISRALVFPAPSSQKTEPEQNVEFQKISEDIGHVRIASWPGILGIEVARQTDAAVRALNCKRLIVDLRGNFGSVGAGNLRLMSYFTAERIPVGYSLTRRRAEEGYQREALPRFERIPRWKIQGLPILWRFRKLDKSIVVVTEGLGPQAFHGNIVLLVNRHTISGAEIVVQFAKEHGLALIVGERTAGKSLSFGTFQLPHEYRFTLPIGDYVTWSGIRFEHRGIEPDVPTHFAPSGQDNIDGELAAGIQILQSGVAFRHCTSK
ncbi:MAG: S41 family peptidase [Bryobacteraceae bacterium]